MIVWFTGLSGSGKTTHAKRLQSQFPEFCHIDADVLRETINSDLGFTVKDRKPY